MKNMKSGIATTRATADTERPRIKTSDFGTWTLELGPAIPLAITLQTIAHCARSARA